MDKLGNRGTDEDDSSPSLDTAGDGAAPPLTMRHLQGVFFILGLAWVAGGGVLGLELLTHRRAQTRGRYFSQHYEGNGKTSTVHTDKNI